MNLSANFANLNYGLNFVFVNFLDFEFFLFFEFQYLKILNFVSFYLILFAWIL